MGQSAAPSISPDVAASLATRGWAVVDSFFPDDFAEGLRDEMVTLAAMGKLARNKTYFANPAGGRYLFSKPHIFEVDLHQVRSSRFGKSARLKKVRIAALSSPVLRLPRRVACFRRLARRHASPTCSDLLALTTSRSDF